VSRLHARSSGPRRAALRFRILPPRRRHGLFGHHGRPDREAEGRPRATLADAGQVIGWRGCADAPDGVLLRHNGLHLEDPDRPIDNIGKDDPAGVADVVVESALTAIQDLEDFIAAVDAEDKVGVYRNWLGLMKGDLSASSSKGGAHDRPARLNPDRAYTGAAQAAR
jgi:malate synthase